MKTIERQTCPEKISYAWMSSPETRRGTMFLTMKQSIGRSG
jgi:hypothetical protein